MTNPSRSVWVQGLWYAAAVGNAVVAFTDGPTFWGWDFPDGLSGMLSMLCLFWVTEDGKSR